MEVQMCAPHTNFISFGHALGRETASSYGSFIFNFCGISTLFPTLVYIPASCVLRLLSPHLSAGTCCLLSLKQPFTLGFSVTLHWWSERENIFLFCSWWPVGHLLLRNVYLSRHLFHICGDSLGLLLLPIHLFGFWVPKFLITLDQTEIDCKLSKVTYTASYSILSGGKAS